MVRYPRKTTPGVAGGKSRRKNRLQRSPTIYDSPLDFPAVERQRPGAGYKHFLLKRHIHDFVAILPDWPELSKGLKVVLLAEHDDGSDGWCDIEAVTVCAWPREEWIEVR